MMSLKAMPNKQPVSTMTCSLCCEDKPASSMFVLQQCPHESCKDCLIQWIEKQESSGRSSLPICPFCRVMLSETDTLAILGRPYQPRTPTTTAPVEEQLDDLTLQWLQEHTRLCPGCGSRIEKQPGGCDMMECLCGYRFCYGCGSTNAECSCTPAHHNFWDNVLDKFADYSDPVQALVDEETGLINLRAHIIERKRQYRTEQVRFVRKIQRIRILQEQEEEMNDFTSSAKWLYCKREVGLRILEQQVQARKVRNLRAATTWVAYDARTGLVKHVIENGVWLFKHKTSAKTLKLLASLYQNLAQFENKPSQARFWASHRYLSRYRNRREKTKSDEEENAIAIRLLFLVKADQAKEREDIEKNGL